MEDVDVVVVGGSYAGLQAALTLGRARRRVVVVDDARPRNRAARHVHNFLGQPGPAPGELLSAGRAALAPYDVTLVAARVSDAQRGADGRLVVAGRWSARALVVATGLVDEPPEVPGVAGLWGDLVVACPHCHGWEVRDRPLIQLGRRGRAARGVDRAVLLSRWSADVTLFTDGDELDDAQLARAAAAGVRVRHERVLGVRRGHDGAGLLLDGGEEAAARMVFAVTGQRQASDLAERLGCASSEDGGVAADPTGRTAVPGVWVAGTAAVPALLAVGAAGHAATMAVALHADLIESDITR